MDNREALKTFMTGENFYLQHYLGAHREELNGEHGYTFRVWAPNAQAVHLVGDFTNWIENQIPMVRNDFGVWEVFTNMAQEGYIYKYHVTRQNGHQLMKIDPFAVRYEARPGTGAILTELPEKKWKDGLWLARRKRWGFEERPVNIYEVHAGSWKRNSDGSPYSFAQLKDELIPYLVEMNYTHIEFMPLMSHPLGLSWGYQLMGYFALEHAYGRPEEFQDFVEECHTHNIGVIVDWVPGHFTINDDALAYYDGTPTFEYQDHNKAHNHGWGALNFDLGKNEVQSFLISCIKHWIDVYHLDGIRVDAVSNMLYLDYDVQIVLLGTGDPAFEGAFSWFAQIYPDKLSTNITFDVKLAQEIYAACDLFLMPSRFEPCGLSQMMAMRYGTLPLVHEVGGLRDTVRAFNPIEGSGTGFSFDNLSPYWLNWTFQTALDLYRNHPDIWRNLQKQAMESDFSWDTACKSYLDLYHSLVN